MADQNSSEEQFVSVNTEALIQAEAIEADQLDDVVAGFEQKSRSIGLLSELEHRKQEFSPALRSLRSRMPELAQWIEFQQHAMMELASQLDAQKDLFTDTELQQVSISAAGVVFSSHQTWQAGSHIQLIISLGKGMPTFLALGVLVNSASSDNSASSGESSGGADDNTGVKVRFTHIRESDQEVLIRLIHKIQLNEIRAARQENTD